jgi:hypothetical protein
MVGFWYSEEDLMKLQKLGGYASIVLVFVYVAFGMLVPILEGFSGSSDSLDSAKIIAAYKASTIAFHAFYVLCVVAGILTLLLALTLHERMEANAPNIMRIAVIAASIGSALSLTAMVTGFASDRLIAGTGDIAAFRSSHVLLSCVFGASGNAWAWTLLLIGLAAITTQALPRILGYTLFVCGVVMIAQVAFLQLGIVSTLLGLICYVWLGIVLLRKQKPDLGRVRNEAAQGSNR